MQQMIKMVNSTIVYYPHQIKASPLNLHNNSRHVFLPYEDKTFKVQLGYTYVINTKNHFTHRRLGPAF